MTAYREVPGDTVPRRSYLAALGALDFARVDLALPAPLRVRWFDVRSPTSADLQASLGGPQSADPPDSFEHDDTGGTILGRTRFHDDDTIWVRAYQSPTRTAEIVFHESHHAAARALAGPPRGSIETRGRETLALEYERNLAEVASFIARQGVDHA